MQDDDFIGVGFGGKDNDVVLMTNYGAQVAQDPNLFPPTAESTTYRVLLSIDKFSGGTPGTPISMSALSRDKFPINPMHVAEAIDRLEDFKMVERREMGE